MSLKNAEFIFLYVRAFKNSCSAELSMEKSFITRVLDSEVISSNEDSFQNKM